MTLPFPRSLQWEQNLDRVGLALGRDVGDARNTVRAGSIPLALQPGEVVLFTTYISCGLGLPLSAFFATLLEDYGLQLQHLTPASILVAAVFAHFCEQFVGVMPCTALFRHFFVLKTTGKTTGPIGSCYFQTRPGAAYLPGF